MAGFAGVDMEAAQSIAKDAAQGRFARRNDNAPGQVVISGQPKPSTVLRPCRRRGFKRSIKLPVSAPSMFPDGSRRPDVMRAALDRVTITAGHPGGSQCQRRGSKRPQTIRKFLVNRSRGRSAGVNPCLCKAQGVDKIRGMPGRVLCRRPHETHRSRGFGRFPQTPQDIEAFLSSLSGNPMFDLHGKRCTGDRGASGGLRSGHRDLVACARCGRRPGGYARRGAGKNCRGTGERACVVTAIWATGRAGRNCCRMPKPNSAAGDILVTRSLTRDMLALRMKDRLGNGVEREFIGGVPPQRAAIVHDGPPLGARIISITSVVG